MILWIAMFTLTCSISASAINHAVSTFKDKIHNLESGDLEREQGAEWRQAVLDTIYRIDKVADMLNNDWQTIQLLNLMVFLYLLYETLIDLAIQDTMCECLRHVCLRFVALSAERLTPSCHTCAGHLRLFRPRPHRLPQCPDEPRGDFGAALSGGDGDRRDGRGKKMVSLFRFPLFTLNMITLPRQARDRHRESSKKARRFLAG
jgi:hypothetical protein